MELADVHQHDAEHLPSEMQKDDSKEESSIMKTQKEEEPNSKMQQPVFFFNNKVLLHGELRNRMKQYHVAKVVWSLGMMTLLYAFLFCRIVTSDGLPIDPLHAKLFRCAQAIVIFLVYLLG
ncbi:unnamed protein product [Alopecurus aequalis]